MCGTPSNYQFRLTCIYNNCIITHSTKVVSFIFTKHMMYDKNTNYCFYNIKLSQRKSKLINT